MSASGRVARARAVLPSLVVAGILVALLVNTARPLTNTDTYFHLRFGQEFLSGRWSLRHPGSVTTFATRDWTPTQWLSEIAMARVEDWWGLAGVAWLSGLLQVALFVTAYAATRPRAGALVTAALVATGLYACESGLSMRPQVLSYLLVAVTVGAWLRTREDGRPRWWLVPLTWLWAMLHGMWPVGLAIGLVAVVGIALDRAPRRVVLRALAVPLGSAVAAALTPLGPAVYPAVLAVGTRASYFAEWAPPDYTTPSCLALAALLVLTLVAMWRRPRNSWTEIALVVLAIAGALYSLRTVPVAAMIVVPVAAAPVQAWVGPLAGRRTPMGRSERGVVLGGSALALVVLALAVPHTSSDPMSEPAWLAPALSRLPPGTKVLDDWGQGGYLMWRYPRLDLMMHGYGDTFTTDELDRNTSLLQLDAGWDGLLRSSGTRVALLNSYSRLSYALTTEEGWHTVHASDGMVMLRAPAAWQSYASAVVTPAEQSAR